MSRMRIALPILLSSLSIPALANSTDYCSYANWHTPQCESQRTSAFERARNNEITASLARVKAERDRAFAVARNIEINASVARVETLRARELALSLTHCKTADSTTPRCLAERAHQVALNLTHCKSTDSTTPRCEAERAREFAEARNAEINASMARVWAERKRAFTAARNAEINASVARVQGQKSAEFAMNLTHCKTPDSTTPRCLAERGRNFAEARNAEIDASIARVAAVREFARARNAEIEASMARVLANRERELALSTTQCKTADSTTPRCLAERERQFARERNAEIEASMAMVEVIRSFARARNAEITRSLAAAKAERERKFAIRQNAAIDASMARVAAARQRGEVVAYYEMPPIETGAINFHDVPTRVVAAPVLYHASAQPCREAGYVTSPLLFSAASANLDEAMKQELDRLVMVANACPEISIEIHGHSDAAGPVQINRALADRRATAAVDYLVSSGVARKRLTAIGHGSMSPMLPNTNATNRALNRRVEIDIKDPAINPVAVKIMADLAELLDPAYAPRLARLTP